MRLRLRKWYFDVVTPRGDAAIAYSARLECGPFSLPYTAILTLQHGRIAECQTWKRSRVDITNDACRWKGAALRAAGCWTRLQAAPRERLLSRNGNRIIWQVYQSAGPAAMKLPGGKVLHGQGYAEKLELDLAKLRLPFDELRWGRFIADDGGVSAVWIDWRGGMKRQWLFMNGSETRPARITDDEIRSDSLSINFDQLGVLRDESLGNSLFSHLGSFARLVPLASAHETKWLSRASLTALAQKPIDGWVIHEVVRWN